VEPLLASGAVPAQKRIVYPLEKAGEAIGSLEDKSGEARWSSACADNRAGSASADTLNPCD
jgi:hypothetical protein